MGVYQLIKQRKPLREIADLFPSEYIRYNRGIKDIKSLRSFRREDEPEIHLMYGPPGVGKTWAVYEATKDRVDDLWRSPLGSDGTWFDGYDDHTDALFDDFDGRMSKCPLQAFLHLTDRYRSLQLSQFI